MKGTHWVGLILSVGMGCATKDDESGDSGGTNEDLVDASGIGTDDGGTETGGTETGGTETGGTETGGADDDGTDDGGTEGGGTETGGTDELVLPSGLNGSIVDPAVALVDFSALNMDGTERTMADLVDGPTVMWFYPAAATPG